MVKPTPVTLHPDTLPSTPTQPANGRPSLRTPELVEKICHGIRHSGHSDSFAAAMAGISTSTVSRWRKEDEEFAVSLDRARGEFLEERLKDIREHRKRDGTLDWRAQAWLLQYAAPEVFGPPTRRHRLALEKVQAEKEELQAHHPDVMSEEDHRNLLARRRVALEKMQGKSDAEARWVAFHMFQQNPPPFPGVASADGHGEMADSKWQRADGQGAASPPDAASSEPLPSAISHLPCAAPAPAPKPLWQQIFGALAGHPENATNLPETPAAPSQNNAQSFPKPPRTPAPATIGPISPIRPIMPPPATGKPSQNPPPTAAQRSADAAAERAEWRRIHESINRQWARSTNRAMREAELHDPERIPGMWAGG